MSNQSAFNTYTDFGFAFEHAEFTSNALTTGQTWCREMNIEKNIIYYTGSNGLDETNNHSLRIDTRITSGSLWMAGVGIGVEPTATPSVGKASYYYGGLISSALIKDPAGGLGDPLPGPERIIIFITNNNTAWYSAGTIGSINASFISYSEPIVTISYDKWYNIRLDNIRGVGSDSVRVSITDSNTGLYHGSVTLNPGSFIPNDRYVARYPHFFSARYGTGQSSVYFDNFKHLAE